MPANEAPAADLGKKEQLRAASEPEAPLSLVVRRESA
jgi:hypothetical protein